MVDVLHVVIQNTLACSFALSIATVYLSICIHVELQIKPEPQRVSVMSNQRGANQKGT